MASSPSIQLYIGDWLTDPALTDCEPSTRGIWIDLICVIWKSDDGGKVTGDMRSLARKCRCDSEEMSKAIDELEKFGVANIIRHKNGTISVRSRRLTKMLKALHLKRARDRKSYHKGKKEDVSDGHSDGIPDADSDGVSDAPSGAISRRMKTEEGRLKKEEGEESTREGGDHWALEALREAQGSPAVDLLWLDAIPKRVRNHEAWGAALGRAVVRDWVRPFNVTSLLDEYDRTVQTLEKDHGKPNQTGRPLTARQQGAVSVADTIAAFDEYAGSHGLVGPARSARAIAEHASRTESNDATG
jgi:hypothetical protein